MPEFWWCSCCKCAVLGPKPAHLSRVTCPERGSRSVLGANTRLTDSGRYAGQTSKPKGLSDGLWLRMQGLSWASRACGRAASAGWWFPPSWAPRSARPPSSAPSSARCWPSISCAFFRHQDVLMTRESNLRWQGMLGRALWISMSVKPCE